MKRKMKTREAAATTHKLLQVKGLREVGLVVMQCMYSLVGQEPESHHLESLCVMHVETPLHSGTSTFQVCCTNA